MLCRNGLNLQLYRNRLTSYLYIIWYNIWCIIPKQSSFKVKLVFTHQSLTLKFLLYSRDPYEISLLYRVFNSPPVCCTICSLGAILFFVMAATATKKANNVWRFRWGPLRLCASGWEWVRVNASVAVCCVWIMNHLSGCCVAVTVTVTVAGDTAQGA